MKKYLGILKFDNDTKIPMQIEEKDKAVAFLKIATYCTKTGYFPDKIEIFELFENIGIIEI